MTERIAALRALMEQEKIDAAFVPSTDPHQSEYVADAWQRRRFISGFDGSAGTVVVCRDRAGLWTDSRYFLQAEQQLAGSGIELFRLHEQDVPDPESWLVETLTAGARVGLDAAVVSVGDFERLKEALAAGEIELVPGEPDLVERAWGDARPALPAESVRAHPLEFAGESAADKLSRLRRALAEFGADAHLLVGLDEIAWLFNLRGADVAFNPVFVAFAVVDANRATLFVDLDKLAEPVRATLPDDVIVLPYESFDSALAEMGASGATVWIDPATVSQRVASSLEQAGARLKREASPVPTWKAVKNEAEVAGMRAVHLRDGLAMVRFLRWLPQALLAGGQTELSLARKLESLRAEHDHYLGPSFATIVGYQANGAIVHYRATEQSALPIKPEGVLLVDSGGQYLDGTTDITRTLALGDPTSEQRRAYTAVLKGHLLLSRSRFPVGTNGYQLDVLARAPLWDSGLNYGHGTGHGVGAALCVHEGPFSVSLRKNLNPLEPGNILSIEPGTYRAGAYGMRIENVALVEEREQTEWGRFLGFETLTLCPYDRGLIDLEMLDDRERDQIDRYHAEVHTKLAEHLTRPDREWLEQATRPL